MSAHNFFALLKKVPGVAGVIGASVLLSMPVLAQSEPAASSSQTSTQVAQSSSTDSGAASEIELSPEGFEILCERFPLNSRCEGNATSSGDSSTSDSPEDTVSPDESSEPESSTGSGLSSPEGAPVPDQAPDDANDSAIPGGFAPEESDPAAPDSSSLDSPNSLEPPSPGNAPVPDQLPDDANDSATPSSAPDSLSPDVTPSSPGTTSPSDGTSGPQSSAPDMTEQSATAQATPAPAAPAPGAAPAAPAPGATAAPTPGAAASVSEQDLQRFANVIPELQQIQESSQQEVARVIEESGLSRERFGELLQSPDAEADASNEEQQSYKDAVTEIQSIQQETLSQQRTVLQSEGLEPQQFNDILTAVRQNPELQQQVQQLIQQ